MEPLIKSKNVGMVEAFLRSFIGTILIIWALSIGGILGVVVGLIGLIFILTGLFRY